MTKHGIRASHSKSSLDEIEDGPTFEEKETVEILECLGCEHLVVRRTYTHEAHTEAITEFYPPPISRPMPRWSRIIGIGVPGIIRDVLKEVYKALQADSPILATMGARTILDLVMVEKVGDKGSFEQKLEALERNGFVGKKNQEFLAAALDAGNAAAHRGFSPAPSELEYVMDIVENLIEVAYVLERRADKIRRATPPRQKERSGSKN
jgi:hypothetical protein